MVSEVLYLQLLLQIVPDRPHVCVVEVNIINHQLGCLERERERERERGGGGAGDSRKWTGTVCTLTIPSPAIMPVF